MKVLFLTQVLPYPLVGGAKIRAYYMLRQLACRHEVTLVSFVRADDDPAAVAHLRDFCAAVHTVPLRRSRVQDLAAAARALLTAQPIVIARDRYPAMHRQLRALCAENCFDVIHADQTAMAQYALYASDCGRDCYPHGQRPQTLLDQHNALYLLVRRQAGYERGPLRRYIWSREAAQLERYEAALCRAFDHVLTVTAEDRHALLRLLPPREQAALRPRFTVLPICVDPAAQPPVPYRAAGGPPTILHLGTMFWPPNVEGVLWFAHEVLPQVVAAVPDVRFVIAGKNPPPEVAALAAPGAPFAANVEVTGFVPDPAPLLARAAVFVVPLRAGGGMRVKILDAWQWGLPIVSTPLGAEGINLRHGENILLAGDAAGFAAEVVRVIATPELAAQLRAAGRDWVETHYDWRRVYGHLDEIYASLAPPPPPGHAVAALEQVR